MAHRLEPQVRAALASMVEALGTSEALAVGDVTTRRSKGHRMMDYVAATTSPAEGVDTEHFSIPSFDGATLHARWYRRSTGEQPGSAVLFIHGGGMIFGLEHVGAMCHLTVCGYVAASGVPMLVVDSVPGDGFGRATRHLHRRRRPGHLPRRGHRLCAQAVRCRGIDRVACSSRMSTLL